MEDELLEVLALRENEPQRLLWRQNDFVCPGFADCKVNCLNGAGGQDRYVLGGLSCSGLLLSC